MLLCSRQASLQKLHFFPSSEVDLRAELYGQSAKHCRPEGFGSMSDNPLAVVPSNDMFGKPNLAKSLPLPTL